MDAPQKDHLAVLKKYFGHSEFRSKQWEIINRVFKKQDTCVVMATGYGKSLCYQFPPVYHNKLAIVVSPLISLMENQVLGLKMCNIAACQLGSSQTDNQGVMEGALHGNYRLLYVTPEWCSGQYSRDFLTKLNKTNAIILVAIDEAHCISQWGFDFRASYRNLGELRDLLPDVPFMGVTATATHQVRADVCHSLKLRCPKVICTSFDRPNIYLSVSMKGNDILSDIKPLLNKIKKVNGSNKGSTIIYCPTKKITDKVAEELNAGGIKCANYHASLSLKLRHEVHENFVKDIIPIVVATVAFGMGIDKPDVRLVVHYGAPKDLESFYQEIGRAGRDGLQSYCHTFYCKSDFQVSEYFFKNLSGKFLDHKRKLAGTLQYYLQSRECRRKILLSHFDPTGEFSRINNCCDNCSRGQNKGPSYDLTDDALLLLEAAKALNGKFGLTVIILFLRGSESKRLPKTYCSHKLYGIGNRKSEAWWKCLGMLLEREGLLRKTAIPTFVRHNQNKGNAFFPGHSITLSKEGEKYLQEKGGVNLEITEEMMGMVRTVLPRTNDWVETNSGIHTSTERTCEVVELEERKQREMIFNRLMHLRSELSKKLNCMPYMIASMKSLQELSAMRPNSLKALSEVEGMTEAKVNNYGQNILDCISGILNEEESVKKVQKDKGSPECIPIDTDSWFSVEQFKKKGNQSGPATISQSSQNLEIDSDEDELFSNLDNTLIGGDNTCRTVDSHPQDGSLVTTVTDARIMEQCPQFMPQPCNIITSNFSPSPKDCRIPSVQSSSVDEPQASDISLLPATIVKTHKPNIKRTIEYETDSESDDSADQPKKWLTKKAPRKKAPKSKQFCL